ncbi:MAG: CehA/McbA family metallohydrolase [Verrucomicrobiales bacterium]
MKPVRWRLIPISACLVGAILSPSVRAEPVALEPVTGMLHPRLSPDGERIAVSWQGAISVLPVEGDTLTRLTRGVGWDVEPAWSPDGKTIAFLRTPNFHGGRLLLLDVESGEVRDLAKVVRGEGKLWFSADGKRLLGRFSDKPGQSRIAWLDLATGALSPLPIGPEDPDRFRRKRIQFAPSADGTHVIYAAHRDEPGEQGGNRGPESDVARCRVDGSGAEALFTWPARIYDLAPKPDGTGVVVVTDLGTTHNDLWRLPFAEPLRKAERITASHADDDRPAFDEAGATLVWTDNADGATALRTRDEGTARVKEIPVTNVDFGEPTGRLALTLIDGAEGDPVPARVSIRREDGKFFFPPNDALYRLTGETGHFYTKGAAAFDLPAGDYAIRAFRGPEYRIAERAVTVKADAEAKEEIAMTRWIDLAERGWFSGENHVHANYGYGEWYNTPATVFRQCAGEDLNVCNAVIGNSDGDAVFDREFFLGQLDPRSTDEHLLYWGEEFRSTIWGHMTLSNLTTLIEPIMTGFEGTTNPWDVPTNADIAERAIDQDGLVGYTHPAGNRLDLYDQPYSAKGLPVDAALGRVALMDVHGHTYEGSIHLWYRLMNCGLEIAGSSGTDVFLNRVRSFPMGWARTYVHLPEGLTYARWTAGQRAGRSFFTNGPMLRFLVDGHGMGESVSLSGPGTVTIEAKAESPVPLDRVEIVQNGSVVRTIELAGDGRSARFAGELEVSHSGWLALRAHGPPHPDIVREPTAHTNPVRVEVPGAPNPETARDAAFFLKWIDRLEADLEERDRIPNERLWNHVRAQLDGARDYYRGLR